MKRILSGLILFAVVVCGPVAVYAGGTSTPAMIDNNNLNPNDKQDAVEVSLYDQGVAASKANNFEAAEPLLAQALQADPNNPDILNMLAHAQRKLGKIDEALANYKKALELRPDFPEAREYLGEAYIDAAMQEAETLKGYGANGSEQLEDLSKAFKDAAGKL